MARSSDIFFITEYIKNVLYFATVRQGKILKDTNNTHYFSIDNDLVYENYYSDFGPLNLSCVYKYCKLLNEKLQFYLNKQCIVHYTSTDPKKKANAAFLLGCYGVLYLSLTPKDALKRLTTHGQSYRPFQDATHGDSIYTISLIDCLQGLAKGRDLKFFNFQDFNYDEYDRLNKLQGGDLNWIIPGKFLAFIGPVDCRLALYHPPEMYIDYFLENNVKNVIRLNKRLYDGNVFTNMGINHYNLFFPDGSCPPRHILLKFLQISEESDGAIAVHCKAGLGRTGSLIGCYLIKHYRMTAHEAIAWMRICRPGSVIGHQQVWLEELEAWLTKQGNLYRRNAFQDIDKVPVHEFGVYSYAEKSRKYRPVLISKLPSPPPPIQRVLHPETSIQMRPQASRVREDNQSENNDDEHFLASCDLTIESKKPMTHLKGCVIKDSTSEEITFNEDSEVNVSLWKKYLCCKPCKRACNDKLWWLAVRCAKITPKRCHTNRCCIFFDLAAPSKTTENDHVSRDKMSHNQKLVQKGHTEPNYLRRGSGESRNLRPTSRCTTPKPSPQGRTNINSNETVKISGYIPNGPFRSNQTTPIAKTLDDAKNLLLRSTHYKESDKHLSSSITIKPHYSNISNLKTYDNITRIIPTNFTSGTRDSLLPKQRRRLGRSPSPIPIRTMEQSRATNTPQTARYAKDTIEDTIHKRDSKSALREALSRLQLTGPRDGSIGAASLGARRDAPPERRAPSVRSDERPLATQGDMLNSIKFQRRLREMLATDRSGKSVIENNNTNFKEKSSIRNVNSKTSSNGTRPGIHRDIREKPATVSPKGLNRPRPSSPKGRRSPHVPFYT